MPKPKAKTKTTPKKAVPKARTQSSRTKGAPRASVKKTRRFRMPTMKELWTLVTAPFVKLYHNLRQKRREATHKSFVRTRKRDKVKIPKVEGYFAFPGYVARVLWKQKWLYIRLVLLVVVMAVFVVGSVQVVNTGNLNSLLDVSNMDPGGGTSPVTRAFMTITSSLGGALNSNLTDVQKLFMSAIYVIVLLTVIWILRQQLAGEKVIVRDGLYNSSGPFAAEYILILIGILQLIPVALATVLYVAGIQGGILDGGIETALFTVALLFIGVLTLYFMTTTLFAMFIATIPGTYPMRAYQVARQIVAGQRVRLLMRILWLLIIIIIAWFMFLMPVIIIANSIGVGSTIVIPIAVQTMLAISIVYGIAYLYLLYRRMIDDPANET